MSENSPKLTDITTNLSQTQPIPKYINSLFTSQIKSQNQNPKSSTLTTMNKKQYITKIRILQRQVEQLQSQLEYKTQAHARQLQNIKIFMQYQMQQKCQKHKNKLRQQYHNLFIQLQKHQNGNHHYTKQISILEQKINRLQNYIKELQSEKQIKELQYRQKTLNLQNRIEEQIRNRDQKIDVLKADLKVQNKINQENIRMDIGHLETKIQCLTNQNQSLRNIIADLKEKNTDLRIQIENQKLVKDREIIQLKTRLNIHRQTSIQDYMYETRIKRTENLGFIEAKNQKQKPKLTYTQNLRKQIQQQNDRMKTALSRDRISASTTKKKDENAQFFGKIKKKNQQKLAQKIYTQQKSRTFTVETNFDDNSIYSEAQSPKFATISH